MTFWLPARLVPLMVESFMTELGNEKQRLQQLIADYAQECDLPFEEGAGLVTITLPGEAKLRTIVALRPGQKRLRLAAFIARNPDENHEEVYRLLLRRNLRMTSLAGIAYAIDTHGDIYVHGGVSSETVTVELLDEMLGAILQASDGIFNEILARGFISSMQKEWDWRISRGESTRNLRAFAEVLQTRSS